MTLSVATLASSIIAAHCNSSKVVPAADFAGLTYDQALEVQNLVRMGLGRDVPAAKIGMAPDGTGMVAPIFADQFWAETETPVLPRRGLAGVEVEVAIRLGRDLTPELAEAPDSDLLEAIAEFLLVVEIIASRFDDRRQAGAWGTLADNMAGGGLVYSCRELDWNPDINGAPVSIEMNGDMVISEKAKHPFGSVLRPLRAVAKRSNSLSLSLRRGMIVTTGSLCHKLVPLEDDCVVKACLGNRSVGPFELKTH